MEQKQHEAAHDALTLAIERAGGQSAFARLIGLKQPSVHAWVKNKKIIPAEHVLTVEAAGFGDRHDLRPDLYPKEPAR